MNVKKFLNKKYLDKLLNEIIIQTQKKIYKLKFKSIKFLCYNPHCGENNTIGYEDKIISKSISKFKKITGPYSADSAFKNLKIIIYYLYLCTMIKLLFLLKY